MNITVLNAPARGSEMWRTIFPLNWYRYDGWSVRYVNPKDDAMRSLVGSDVLVANMPCTREHMHMIGNALTLNIPIIVDVDDHLEFPEDHPSYEIWESEAKKFLLDAIAVADIVTHTNEFVAASFEHSRKILVPNPRIPISRPEVGTSGSKTAKIVIRGGVMLNSQLEGLEDVMKRLQSHANIYILGESVQTPYSSVSIPFVSPAEYFLMLGTICPDFIVKFVPQHPYFKAKSEIAAIEAAWCGAGCACNVQDDHWNIPGVLTIEQMAESVLDGTWREKKESSTAAMNSFFSHREARINSLASVIHELAGTLR